jgi:hypothetical protein
MLTVKRLGVALRFFGSLPPRPDCNRLIAGDGLSPIRTSRGSFIPTTAANVPRRRNKVFGFIIAEGSAIGLLLVTGALALSLKPADPTLAWSINLVTIAAAAAVAIIPILFFAIAPVLPRADR